MNEYRSTEACDVAGVTYRQLDYWARVGIIAPSIQPAAGYGSSRRYSFDDVVALTLVRVLSDHGFSRQSIRGAIEKLRIVAPLGAPDAVLTAGDNGKWNFGTVDAAVIRTTISIAGLRGYVADRTPLATFATA